MFLFYCIGNEQYIDQWKAKLGIASNKTSKGSNSTSMAGNTRPSNATMRVSVVEGSGVTRRTEEPSYVNQVYLQY